MNASPKAIQHPDGRVEHRWDEAMLAVALLVVPVVLLDDAEPHGAGHIVAEIANWVIWAVFAVELVLVLRFAGRRRAALRSHWLDVLIVAMSFPVLPGLFAVTRLGRLLRLLRLALFGTRALRSERRLSSTRGFRLAGVITVVLVMSAGFAISLVDTHDFPNAWLGVWWAVVTVTTVGYGDVVPHTVAGRFLGALLMLGGIGFLSIVTATIASSFLRADTNSEHEQAALRQELAQMREQLARIERALANDRPAA